MPGGESANFQIAISQVSPTVHLTETTLTPKPKAFVVTGYPTKCLTSIENNLLLLSIEEHSILKVTESKMWLCSVLSESVRLMCVILYLHYRNTEVSINKGCESSCFHRAQLKREKNVVHSSSIKLILVTAKCFQNSHTCSLTQNFIGKIFSFN